MSSVWIIFVERSVIDLVYAASAIAALSWAQAAIVEKKIIQHTHTFTKLAIVWVTKWGFATGRYKSIVGLPHFSVCKKMFIYIVSIVIRQDSNAKHSTLTLSSKGKITNPHKNVRFC
jgi:hypothetical protein